MEEAMKTAEPSFEALTIDQKLDRITLYLSTSISYLASNTSEGTFKLCARTALYSSAVCNFDFTYGKLATLVILEIAISRYSQTLLNTIKKAADYISEACVEL